VSREERRRRTEATILEAARELFAELGYERATIRGVASRAGVDPALVMQYFGSKEGLFTASARWHVDQKRITRVPRGDLPHTVVDDLLRSGEDGGSLALLRSCLTHDAAREVLREEVLCEVHAAVARTIGGPDAELRAGLLAGISFGLSIGRYLIQVPGLADASREDLERVLLPVLEALVEPG
jgi:AcrR family transcriptional regulator